MKKIILQNSEDLLLIKRTFGISKTTISRALNFHTHSHLASAIRKFSIEHGASLVNDDNKIETIFNESTNEMIQKFGSNAEIRVNKDSNFAILSIRGKSQVQIKNCTIPELLDLQETAFKLINTEK